jgi:uncharacterized protein (TIGR02271 family)
VMPHSQYEIQDLITMRGKPVYGSDGEKLGELEDVYQDEDTRQPEWLAIKESMVGGLFGTKHFLVPVMEAQLSSGRGGEEPAIRVPYTKDKVKDAPQVGGDWISEEQEQQVYAYYGIKPTTEHSDTQLPRAETTTHERPTAPTTRGDSDEISMGRSEEELRVGKREVDAGRVRLRKWVETEPVSEDVELRRETAQVERHQVNQPVSGADIGEEEAEMRLHREEPVVGKETVEKERIDAHREEVVEHEQARADLRKEQVEVDDNPHHSRENSGEGDPDPAREEARRARERLEGNGDSPGSREGRRDPRQRRG